MRTTDEQIGWLARSLRSKHELMKHLRIGQILVGAASVAGRDLFYIENEDLFKAIEDYDRKTRPADTTTGGHSD